MWIILSTSYANKQASKGSLLQLTSHSNYKFTLKENLLHHSYNDYYFEIYMWITAHR